MDRQFAVHGRREDPARADPDGPGSQQALDLLGKVLIDEGSRVLVETPSYLGALQAFSVYRPEFASVATDDDGLVPRRSTPSPKARACCTRCRTSRTRPAARCRSSAAWNWWKPAPAWACR
jgi:aspartate/methionine/tyrosine aminotransferase